MYARFRRTGLGRASEPVWSAMAVHRPARFNGPYPFFAGEDPEELRQRVPVRAVARSGIWKTRRRRAPRAAGRAWPDGQNVPRCGGQIESPCFSLNDYEWMLAFKADELYRIVDLMRAHLRSAGTRSR